MRRRNIDASKVPHVSSFRKIAIGSWPSPRDSSTYGQFSLDISAVNDYLKHYNKAHHCLAALHHFVAKTMGYILGQHPDLNQFITRGHLRQRSTVSVFFTTLLKSGHSIDLSGIQINDPASHSLASLTHLSTQKISNLRQGKDPEIRRVQRILSSLPTWTMPFFYRLIDFLSYTINLNPHCYGVPYDRFGSIVISPVGSLGVEQAFIPLFPLSRTPIGLSIGKPVLKPTLVKDVYVPRPHVTFSVTIDHRIIDGYPIARALRLFKKIFSNPNHYSSIFEGHS